MSEASVRLDEVGRESPALRQLVEADVLPPSVLLYVHRYPQLLHLLPEPARIEVDCFRQLSVDVIGRDLVIQHFLVLVSGIGLQQLGPFLRGSWYPLLPVDYPVSHETTFYCAAEDVDQNPADCDHSGGPWIFGPASAADPAFEDVVLQLAVDELVYPVHDPRQLRTSVFSRVAVADVLWLYFELLLRDDLAVAEPLEEAGYLGD